MKKGILIGIGIAALVYIVATTSFRSNEEAKPVPIGKMTAAPEGPGWINMLDEDHREGWGNINDDVELFEISDGMIHLFGNSHDQLRYVGYETERLGNFELHVEVKLEPGGNSGIFLRQQPNDEIYRGFEVQVQDDFGVAPNKNTTGAIYDVVTPMFNMAFPAGSGIRTTSRSITTT